MEEKQAGVSQKIRMEGEPILLPGSQCCLAMKGAQGTSARRSRCMGGHLRTRRGEAGDAVPVLVAPLELCPVPPASTG